MSDLIPIGTDLTEFRWSPEEIDLIKRTVGKGQDLTSPELLLFGCVCKQSGLNPFLKDIYPVKFNKGEDNESLTFITSIGGYRAIAESTGVYAGRDDILFDEGLTQFQMIKEKRLQPSTATCTVYKLMGGIRNPTTATVRWVEYYPTDTRKQAFWKSMPFNQLGKCSEASSLRISMPRKYAGIYLDIEIDRSDARPTYQLTEDNIDLINEIDIIYKEMLGYNPARIIAKNIEIVGDNDLNRIPKEKLEILKYQLQALVEKADSGGEQNVYGNQTGEK